MGKGLHLGLVASLLLAFVQAPLRHAHTDDPGHAHAKGLSHAHLSDHHSDAPAWDADDHDSDVRMLEWLAGDGTSSVKFVPALPQSVAGFSLVQQASLAPEFAPRSHDPPSRLNLHPRAPPV